MNVQTKSDIIIDAEAEWAMNLKQNGRCGWLVIIQESTCHSSQGQYLILNQVLFMYFDWAFCLCVWSDITYGYIV